MDIDNHCSNQNQPKSNMLQNQDMRSKYLQTCFSVQNQRFCKQIAKKGRKNDLLGNRSNKENHNHWRPLYKI
jgi:hypothetical protein